MSSSLTCIFAAKIRHVEMDHRGIHFLVPLRVPRPVLLGWNHNGRLQKVLDFFHAQIFRDQFLEIARGQNQGREEDWNSRRSRFPSRDRTARSSGTPADFDRFLHCRRHRIILFQILPGHRLDLQTVRLMVEDEAVQNEIIRRLIDAAGPSARPEGRWESGVQIKSRRNASASRAFCSSC